MSVTRSQEGVRSIVGMRRSAATIVVSGIGLLCTMSLDTMSLAVPSPAAQAPAAASHVTIPFLANATKPSDLDFQAGECDIEQAGKTMTCQFQQVFLTVSPLNPDTCLITTNRYERVFQKESNTRWTSSEGPEKVVTSKTTAPACRSVDETSEILSWQNIRRPLPCTFVQPGAISR